MDLQCAPQVVSSEPLIEAIATANKLSRLRPNWRALANSAGRAAAWISLLVLSVVLFSTGFLLTSATLLLAFARFTGANIGLEILAQCICSVIVTTWASGLCWEKMHELLGRGE